MKRSSFSDFAWNNNNELKGVEESTGRGGGETQSILDRSLTWLNLGAYLRCDVRCLLDIIVSADRIRCFFFTDYYVGGPCPTLVLFFFGGGGWGGWFCSLSYV